MHHSPNSSQRKMRTLATPSILTHSTGLFFSQHRDQDPCLGSGEGAPVPLWPPAPPRGAVCGPSAAIRGVPPPSSRFYLGPGPANAAAAHLHPKNHRVRGYAPQNTWLPHKKTKLRPFGCNSALHGSNKCKSSIASLSHTRRTSRVSRLNPPSP